MTSWGTTWAYVVLRMHNTIKGILSLGTVHKAWGMAPPVGQISN